MPQQTPDPPTPDPSLTLALPDVRVIVLRADGMARYRPDTIATEE